MRLDLTYPASQETLALLGNSAIFRNLNPVQLEEIVSTARYFQVQRRSFFFHQGEPANTFYLLLEGNAHLTQITPEGRQVILHYFGPGDVMAVVAALANGDYPGSAEATTDCAVLSWDRETAIQTMEQYPRLALNSMDMVAGRFWELQNRYRELATQRVERRVAHAILRLDRQGNGRDSQHRGPTLLLSRQELAEMTGTTLFTVSRICSQWEQQGILVTGREQIRLLKPEALTAIAEDLPIGE